MCMLRRSLSRIISDVEIAKGHEHDRARKVAADRYVGTCMGWMNLPHTAHMARALSLDVRMRLSHSLHEVL